MNYSDLDFGATIRGFSAGRRVFNNRYELIRKLGRGGMGEVWLAEDSSLGQEVALKFLPELLRHDSKSVDDLKRETRRSLSLTHPHIIRIYDFLEDDLLAGISMEYVSGKTLAELSLAKETRCFETADIEKWIRQLCEAIEPDGRRQWRFEDSGLWYCGLDQRLGEPGERAGVFGWHARVCLWLRLFKRRIAIGGGLIF